MYQYSGSPKALQITNQQQSLCVLLSKYFMLPTSVTVLGDLNKNWKSSHKTEAAPSNL